MSESAAFLVRSARLGTLVLTLAAVAGCGHSKKIDTVPVSGKVVFEKGGTVKGLSDAEAAVAFESVDPPGLRARAEIAEDGTLTNVIAQKQEATEYGLAPGTYRVRLDLDKKRQGLVDPKFLSFEKSGITVKVPNNEGIVIKVWR